MRTGRTACEVDVPHHVDVERSAAQAHTAAAVHTWPSYDDTAQALIPELEKSRLDKIYYLAAADIVAGSAPTWGSKVVVLPKRSLRAAWVFLTSRWVFWTHQCYPSWFPHRVESVNLWHGMLIKKLGWMSAKQVNLQHSKYDLATSEFWEPFVRQCMRPWGKVLVNGLPRHDRFSSLEPVEVGGGWVELSRTVGNW